MGLALILMWLFLPFGGIFFFKERCYSVVNELGVSRGIRGLVADLAVGEFLGERVNVEGFKIEHGAVGELGLDGN